MSCDLTARHEAGHAIAALLLEIPVLAVEVHGPFHGETRIVPDDYDAEAIRDHALMTLCGPICSEGAAGQVPEWPPRHDAEEQDEKELAFYALRLGLDEAGWNRLVLDACRLACSPRFEELFAAVTGELEHTPVIKAEQFYALTMRNRRNTR